MILATFIVDLISDSSTSAGVTLHVSGMSVDGSVNFLDQSGNGFTVLVDPQTRHINKAIEDAVQAKLSVSPFNMTFGAGDSVKLIP